MIKSMLFNLLVATESKKNSVTPEQQMELFYTGEISKSPAEQNHEASRLYEFLLDD